MQKSELSIAQEFLSREWVSYALVELTRGTLKLDDSSDETVDRLDRLTSVLYYGNDQAADRAAQLLNTWLERNPDSPNAPGFRLRYMLLLKKLDQHHAALQQVEILIEKDPNSAALHCAEGVLYGWLHDMKRAIQSFDKAIRLAPTWMEPKLERSEKLIQDGDYKGAIKHIDDYLKPHNLTPREKLILLANRIVASSMSETNYLETEHGKAKQTEIREIEISNRNREDWFMKPTWDHVRDVEALVATKEVKAKLFDLLSLVHKKLMPDDKPLER